MEQALLVIGCIVIGLAFGAATVSKWPKAFGLSNGSVDPLRDGNGYEAGYEDGVALASIRLEEKAATEYQRGYQNGYRARNRDQQRTRRKLMSKAA